MSRLPYITLDNLSDDQQMLFDHITKGKRSEDKTRDYYITPEGGLRGPFNAWLYAPSMGDAAQRLGALLRFEGSLPATLRELAILIVAAKWRCQYEWWSHEKIGRSVGLEDDVIACIKRQEHPRFKDPMQSIVYEFTTELIETRDVSDPMYQKAVGALGEIAVVELATLVGYYMMVSINLNVFRVPLPPGVDPPFGEG